MISPEAIKEKALKIWQSGCILSAWLTGEALFPLDIPFRKVTAREALERFSDVRMWVNRLRERSKETKGFGYSMEFTDVNHRQLGTQQFPSRIWFETAEDFLRFTGRQKDFDQFRVLVAQGLEEQPSLRGWMERKSPKLLEHQDVWSPLLAVCRYLRTNPMPDRYIRELDIPGVDSKFIEQHRSILRELLDIVLPRRQWIRRLPPSPVTDSSGATASGMMNRRYAFGFLMPAWPVHAA